ncbi:hypothetical protein D1872_308550 [compost metagenome]
MLNLVDQSFRSIHIHASINDDMGRQSIVVTGNGPDVYIMHALNAIHLQDRLHNFLHIYTLRCTFHQYMQG